MGFDPAQIFSYLICFISALSVHEWAHAFTAKRFGDRTAELQGRLTLNPIAHIDPVGTIALPLVGGILGLPLIGWAKPVPINPRNFKGSFKYANMCVAFAGPLVNIIMCLVSAIIFVCYLRFGTEVIPEGSFFHPLTKLVGDFGMINAILAIFNLLPIPPLDGAAVMGGMLPAAWGEKYEEFVAPYGFIILILCLMSGALAWIGRLSYSLFEFFIAATFWLFQLIS